MTTRVFNDMLNEFLPLSLQREELIQRNWLLQNVEKDDSWKGGTLIVPFEGQNASSIKFGSLTSANDISEYDYVRGQVADYTEMWGTIKFNHRDILEHDGRVNEKSFLRILPDQIDQFMNYMNEMASLNMLNGAHFATVTDDTNAATGVMIVDRVDRFVLDQAVTLDDNDSAQADYYVISIVLDTNAVTFSATRGGAAADLSAFSVAQQAKFYHPGVLVGGTVTNRFTSLRDSLLSLANGGTATLYGQSKLAYPYLQAINIDGSGITTTNILEQLFDANTEVRAKARGNARTFLMSYRNLGAVMKAIETQKGAFKTTAETKKASLFGWTEIEITSVRGMLTVVGIQDIDDDVIMILDMTSMKWFSNGMFRRRTAPDGKQFYEDRLDSGYVYILDTSLFGDLVVHAPSRNGIIHSVPAL